MPRPPSIARPTWARHGFAPALGPLHLPQPANPHIVTRTMPPRDLLPRVRAALADRYDVVAAIGRGGNATLFGAYDRQRAKVAIKVLHPELAVSVAADRFLREIQYAGQL